MSSPRHLRRWSKRAAKSAAARRVVANLVDSALVPDKDNVVMTMALFQKTLSACDGNHDGLLPHVVQLMEAMLAGAGVVRTVLFVGCGLGHAEYALAELMKQVARADPAKFAPLLHLDAVYTDGALGPEAPPPSAWAGTVQRMTAEEAIARYGHDECVIIAVKPDPNCPTPMPPTGMADAASKKGVPMILTFMEVPTSGFERDELKAAVKAYRSDVDGKPMPVSHVVPVTSCILSDDGQPKCDMTRHDWQRLNSVYVRTKVFPSQVQMMPAWQTEKEMAWISFELRLTDGLSSTAEAPLPKLSGAGLVAMVGRYARLYSNSV